MRWKPESPERGAQTSCRCRRLASPKLPASGLEAQGLLGAAAAAVRGAGWPVSHLSGGSPLDACLLFLGPRPSSFGAFIRERICFFLLDSTETEADTGDRWMAADNTREGSLRGGVRVTAVKTFALPGGCGVNRKSAQGPETPRLTAQTEGRREQPRRPCYPCSRW